VLEEEGRTLDVFVQLAAEHPEEAKNHWSSPDRLGLATRLALDARRLDLLRAQGVDLLQEFERAKQVHEPLARATPQRDPRLAERTQSLADQRPVEDTLFC
jgi:hypothetical protein